MCHVLPDLERRREVSEVFGGRVGAKHRARHVAQAGDSRRRGGVTLFGRGGGGERGARQRPTSARTTAGGRSSRRVGRGGGGRRRDAEQVREVLARVGVKHLGPARRNVM